MFENYTIRQILIFEYPDKKNQNILNVWKIKQFISSKDYMTILVIPNC